MTKELLVYLFTCTSTYICTIFFYFKVLAKKMQCNVYFFLLGLLRIVLSTYIFFHFRNPFANFITSTIFIVLPLLGFKNPSKSLLTSIFLMSFLYITDGIVFYAISYLSEVLPNNIKYYANLNIIGLLLSQFIVFFLILFLSKYIRRILKSDYTLTYNFTFSILPIVSMIILLATRRISNEAVAAKTMLYALVILSMLLLLNISFILLLSNNTNYFVLLIQRNQMEDQIQSLIEQQNLNLINQKKEQQLIHDAKNILISIRSSIDEKKDITSLINSYLDEVSAEEIRKFTNIPVVDALIHVKEISASANGCTILTTCSLQTKITLNYTELSVVMGMILDNAIEAVTKLAEPPPIKLDITTRNNVFVISVTNAFDGIVLYSGETIISSKGQKHIGYGINGIKHLVKKNNGYIDMSHTDNIFCTRIIFYGD